MAGRGARAPSHRRGRGPLLAHLADKADALARDRADEVLALAAVADRPAQRVDSAGQRRFRYDPSAPDRGDEIVLAHHAVAVRNEMDQEVEDLRLERDQLAVTLELPAIGVEVEISEKDEQIQPRPRPERAPGAPLLDG